MKKPWLLITLFTGLLAHAQAQQEHNVFIDTAGYFCSCDTATAIKRLETFTRKYPDSNFSVILNGRLAELYMARNQHEAARACLEKALRKKAGWFHFDCPDSKCKPLYAQRKTGWQFILNQAEMCITMSQLLLEVNRPKEALRYLTLADSDYLPYKDCANGMFMYQTYLSLYFADVYLYMKDTLSTMNRLFRYMMTHEGPTEEVARRLKVLLLTKHSNYEVKQEIQRAMSKLKKYKNKAGEYPDDYVLFSLFNLTPYKAWTSDDRPVKSTKEYLQTHRGIKTLYHYIPLTDSSPSGATPDPRYTLNSDHISPQQHETQEVLQTIRLVFSHIVRIGQYIGIPSCPVVHAFQQYVTSKN